jgi:hypothetical protein
VPISGVNIDCVKIEESFDRVPYPYTPTVKQTHKDYVLKMERESDEVKECVIAINSLDPDCCFDNSSGVTEEQLKDKIDDNTYTFYVFDWDRTISQVEGFPTPPELSYRGTITKEMHLKILNYHLSDYGTFLKDVSKKGGVEVDTEDLDTTFTNETILTAICGGSKRVDYLRKYINKDNSFFITANRMKQMVIDLTQALLGPEFDASKRVFSMQADEDNPDPVPKTRMEFQY